MAAGHSYTCLKTAERGISRIVMLFIVSCLIILATLLDETFVLVVLLALLAPLRCLINSIILFLVTLLFGLVNRSRQVLGRRVDSNQFERLVTLGHELMLSAGGDNDDVSSTDRLIFAGDGSKTVAGRDYENLIDGMNLRGLDNEHVVFPRIMLDYVTERYD